MHHLFATDCDTTKKLVRLYHFITSLVFKLYVVETQVGIPALSGISSPDDENFLKPPLKWYF